MNLTKTWWQWLHKWMNSCLLLPAGYFLLEPWQKQSTSSPHLGVTVTVRDPNHEVVHSKESYITMRRPHKHKFNRRLKHVITGFSIKIKAKLLWTVLHKFEKKNPRALLMISEGYNEPLLLLVRFTAVLRLHLSCWLSGHGLNHSYYTCLNANVINMKVCIQ